MCVRVGVGVQVCVCACVGVYTLSAFIALAAAVVTHLSLPVKPPSALIFGRCSKRKRGRHSQQRTHRMTRGREVSFFENVQATCKQAQFRLAGRTR